MELASVAVTVKSTTAPAADVACTVLLVAPEKVRVSARANEVKENTNARNPTGRNTRAAVLMDR